jgi:micrococcal nuclease
MRIFWPKKHWIGLILLFYFISPVFADVVMEVKDGDTVVIAPDSGGAFYTCRLYGIDAPEIAHGSTPAQPYGEEAKAYLKKLVLGQRVKVITTGGRTYNREVCILEKGGLNINLEMVRAGYAWAYRRYLKRPYASEYIEPEADARCKGLGLWRQTNPQPPWEFRHRIKR